MGGGDLRISNFGKNGAVPFYGYGGEAEAKRATVQEAGLEFGFFGGSEAGESAKSLRGRPRR